MKAHLAYIYCVLVLLAQPTNVVSFFWSKKTVEAVENDLNATNKQGQTCTWEERESSSCKTSVYKDPNLKPMVMKLDGVEETFYAYVEPDVATFYNATPGSMKKIEPSFTGFFGKFINLSNKRLQIYWQSTSGDQTPMFIADLGPFGAAATATYPSHRFILTEPKDPSKVYETWTMMNKNFLYKYDPYGSVAEAEKVLSKDELELYKLQHRNLAFDRLYQHFTGRQWLALYGRKHAPIYHMWPADSIGQTHVITTKETHVIVLPPEEFANKQVFPYGATPEDIAILKQYRSPEETLTLNMTVLSVAPRAFEIRNFLSNEEVAHILELAAGMRLSQSTTRATSNTGDIAVSDTTRTSKNSWLNRERSPILDAIFRRSADLLQIHEGCFRYRRANETHLVPGSGESIAERLQLVHYAVGEQYTPHHDFMIPDLEDGQPSRFATLLLYLNDVPEGGETSFPRWLNGKSYEILKVKPEAGKAVLFYNQLPDGNYDERSQHAALPVIKGEKWLTNLWVWDPYMVAA